MTKLAVAYPIGTRVNVDGDTSIEATLTAYCWRGHGLQVEIQWFTGGYLQTAWVDIWRVRASRKG